MSKHKLKPEPKKTAQMLEISSMLSPYKHISDISQSSALVLSSLKQNLMRIHTALLSNERVERTGFLHKQLFFYSRALEWNQIHYYCGHLLAYCNSPCKIDGDDCGVISGMNEWQGKPKYLEKTCLPNKQNKLRGP
jgi:hypothetical protein